MATPKAKPSKKSTPVKVKAKKEVANKKAKVSKVTEKKSVTKQKVADKSASLKVKAKKEKAIIKPIAEKPSVKKEKAIVKPIAVKPSVKKEKEPKSPIVAKVSKKDVVAEKENKKVMKKEKKSTISSSELPKKEEVVIVETPSVPTYTDEEIEKMRKDHFVKEGTRLGANFSMEQTSKDIESIIAYFCKKTPNTSYEPFSLDKKNEEAVSEVTNNDDRITQLRKECTALGVGFAPAHGIADLEQLLNAVKGAGVTVESRKSFELTLDNLESIKGNPTPPSPFNPTNQVGSTPSFLGNAPKSSSDVSSVDAGQLEMYRNVFMGTILNHFRLMSKNEISGLFAQANYPFSYEIKNHPEQGNKIEIILTSGKSSLRLPNENTNDWINING
jgi:hypothetical protein